MAWTIASDEPVQVQPARRRSDQLQLSLGWQWRIENEREGRDITIWFTPDAALAPLPDEADWLTRCRETRGRSEVERLLMQAHSPRHFLVTSKRRRVL